jgi:hypothetical protein
VKPNVARRTPAEQRAKASKTRGLKRPDVEVRFFFMMTLPVNYPEEMKDSFLCFRIAVERGD